MRVVAGRGRPRPPLHRRGLVLVDVVVAPDDRREQEEGEPGRQEQVADRGDVPDDRERDRQDVGERPRVEQEIEVQARREQDV